jgi:hypothetical protein
MPEIFIIRPTQRATNQRGVPIAQAIIQCGVAKGFVGNLERVRACSTIIIINDEGVSKAGRIKRVVSVAPMEGQTKHRVTVTFGPTRELIPAELRMCAEITWSSSNIRYRTLP